MKMKLLTLLVGLMVLYSCTISKKPQERLLTGQWKYLGCYENAWFTPVEGSLVYDFQSDYVMTKLGDSTKKERYTFNPATNRLQIGVCVYLVEYMDGDSMTMSFYNDCDGLLFIYKRMKTPIQSDTPCFSLDTGIETQKTIKYIPQKNNP